MGGIIHTSSSIAWINTRIPIRKLSIWQDESSRGTYKRLRGYAINEASSYVDFILIIEIKALNSQQTNRFLVQKYESTMLAFGKTVRVKRYKRKDMEMDFSSRIKIASIIETLLSLVYQRNLNQKNAKFLIQMILMMIIARKKQLQNCCR